MRRDLWAEFLGTLMLVMTVVGSGIMAANLAAGNDAVALLGNTIATGAILVVLITIFGPLSGAHFNPAVTFVFLLKKDIALNAALLFILAQIAGGVIGAWLAHVMFELPVMQLSQNPRTGLAQYFAEVVATFGLVMTILLGLAHRPKQVPMLVGLYITAAYWFTASTSFANPAVTIARSFSDTFAGIHIGDTGPFIIAQLIGAVLALMMARMLVKTASN